MLFSRITIDWFMFFPPLVKRYIEGLASAHPPRRWDPEAPTTKLEFL